MTFISAAYEFLSFFYSFSWWSARVCHLQLLTALFEDISENGREGLLRFLALLQDNSFRFWGPGSRVSQKGSRSDPVVHVSSSGGLCLVQVC